jgi:hypothetical protein
MKMYEIILGKRPQHQHGWEGGPWHQKGWKTLHHTVKMCGGEVVYFHALLARVLDLSAQI